jgi:hypothetical protein
MNIPITPTLESISVEAAPGIPGGALVSLGAVAEAAARSLHGQWTPDMRQSIALAGKLDSKRLGLSEAERDELLSALDGICNDIAQVSQEVSFSVSKG